MNTIFISNILTPHQLPLCNELNRLLSGKFLFIETQAIDKRYLPAGWKLEQLPSFAITVETFLNNRKYYEECIDCAHNVIIGSALDKYVISRLRQQKVTFKYSERLYKNGLGAKNYIHAMLSSWIHHKRFQKYPLYMLCASAYTAADCMIFGNYWNKTYKWGYFPEVKKYDSIKSIIDQKEPASILWVARLIELKHPDASITVAKKLKDNGYKFKLRLIGNGLLKDKIRSMIKNKNLQDCVELLGELPPEEVRLHMEKSQIFLFTSDFNEGWGAVLNEAMNSGCAVVASHAIGSVPYLITNGENGLIYRNGDLDDLYNKTVNLLTNIDRQKELGKQAYETLANTWNAKVAAKRFLTLTEELQKNGKCDLFENGPCSKAEILKNDWYI